MKRIMIYAYTNFNLGDDLFIKILCERYPNIKFVLYAPKKYKSFEKELQNLEVISSDLMIRRIINFGAKKIFKKYSVIRKQLAKQSDGCIYIGGSLFMQQENWECKLEEKQSLRVEDKPFWLIGANFGPYKDQKFLIDHKKMFEQYTDICFRDTYSYNLFEEMSNVRRADDVIFQLEYPHETDQKNNTVIVSVIKPSEKGKFSIDDDIYYTKMKKIIIDLLSEGFDVTLMSFCEKEGDVEAIDHIMRKIPLDTQHKISTHLYSGDIAETLEVINNSSLIIAGRFHAMILGWIFKKTVFPIAYSEKITNVINDIGYKGNFIKLEKIEDLNISRVLSNFEEPIIDVTKHKLDAEKQFKSLDKYLANR